MEPKGTGIDHGIRSNPSPPSQGMGQKTKGATMKKHVLLIAGGGTLGGYASMELLKRGYAVDVIALNDCVSLNRNLTWIQKNVDDALLAELFKACR